VVSQQHLARSAARVSAIVVNSGCANACTGEAGMQAARQAQAALPVPIMDRYLPRPFLTDEMGPALVAADLVLGRAGSSTCAEVAAAGVASILVPYPYAGSHQQANAAWLADQGAAFVVEDADLTPDRLVELTDELADVALRESMAKAARELGRPDAAHVLASELLAMADRRPLPSMGDEEAA
jgi:UDP-N-acetylglucosamine--N-acetylmuramyl-(pentapeptide) pyrophosphoryl-undecaprenol N-acetylglucosamine transferase